ncbi:MAG: cytochrome-c peroxidase [Myxococcales bacterium]|nr:cytochrome-c peroxidase [Myxococcales bacterium]
MVRRWILAGLLLTGCDATNPFRGVFGGSGDDEPAPPPNDEWTHPPWSETGPEVVGPPPDFGEPRSEPLAPPPISGGTLLATRDGPLFVADPDRDTLFLVDPKAAKLLGELPLLAGDEPGRAVEDDAQRVHVVLRRGGAIVSVDLPTGKITGRRPVCAAPRGIAFDAKNKDLVVACAGGELVTLPAVGGEPTRKLQVARDLRDVLQIGDRTFFTTFRTAQLFVLDGTTPKPMTTPTHADGRRSSVAWRTVAMGQDSIMMLHQRAADRELLVTAGGYGGGSTQCRATIVGSLSFFPISRPGITPLGFSLASAVLPVDVAYQPATGSLAVVTPANAKTGEAQVWTGNWKTLASCSSLTGQVTVGEIVAAAYLPTGELALQSRQPAFVRVGSKEVSLSTISREDTGHAIFHANSGRALACASCHPEGAEDGLLWQVTGVGPRRTQSLRAGVLANAPFHWDGSVPSFDTLVSTVFEHRMGGPKLSSGQRVAFEHWIDRIPAVAPSSASSAEAAARGKDLFADPAFGCTRCHDGPRFTNGKLVTGKSESLRVPSLLGVAFRSPFGHAGCAKYLADFVAGCGTEPHGATAFPGTSLPDLVAYLETL